MCAANSQIDSAMHRARACRLISFFAAVNNLYDPWREMAGIHNFLGSCFRFHSGYSILMEATMNKFFAAAPLLTGLLVSGVERGEAAPLALPSNLNAAVSQGGGGQHLQNADGWWLAVPLVAGGITLLDHHHRYHHHHHYYRPRAYRSYHHGCYRRCW
jgi:hypothetical protein